MKVAVVDTGVSAQAPTLAGRVSAVGSAGEDCVGHGTFVAGLIAAAPAKNVRVAGVAQESRIIAVRGTDERGTATASSVADGIRAAADAGAKVIQVSPALAADSAGLRSAVKYAASRDALIVAAATPDPAGPSPGREPEPPRDYWPASAPGVLSVIDMDARGTRPDTAPATRGADLAAPGDGVVGVGPRGTGHFIGSGASFAAAYAAGAAALVRSAYPDLSAAGTAERLTRTAYPADVPRLDPYAAVTSVQDPAARPRVERDDSVALPPGNGSGGATRRAVWIAVAGGSLALLVAWVALVAPRGRSRGWRPRSAVGWRPRRATERPYATAKGPGATASAVPRGPSPSLSPRAAPRPVRSARGWACAGRCTGRGPAAGCAASHCRTHSPRTAGRTAACRAY